ncbi:hypothetical protein GOA54_05775 [Sinorhizobium meliloti]|nr:hypothetical protein [Sinorhizobium meliloti]
MNESQTLADEFAHYRQSFAGGGVFALVTMPDGSGFLCQPAGENMDAERLTRDQMLEKLTELYGLSAFRRN